MAKRSSLGRGFGSLIPEGLDTSFIKEDQNRVQNLLISDILPNPKQPRRNFDDKSLNELMTSIKRHGVLQPIIVIKDKQGYRIIAGERRWRAAKSAKLDTIPAIVRSLEELEQIEMALVENVQRVDLSPLEQAVAIYRLQQQFSLELDQIAQKLGKAPSTVSNTARLLQLPDSAKTALMQGQISEGHARAILALRQYPVLQDELLKKILKEKLSVRQAEVFVLNNRPKAKTVKGADELAKKITDKLGLKTVNKQRSVGGEIVISYKNEADLAKLNKKLSL